MNNKSIDELNQERDTLMAEIAELSKKKEQLSSDNSTVKENSKLEEENKQLRGLIEKYKEDAEAANKLTVDTLRNFSLKTNDPGFFGDDGKTQDEKDYEKAKSNIDEWVKNFKETGKF